MSAALPPEATIEQIVRAYLQAFEDRDLERCLAFFTDDSVVRFYIGQYRGRNDLQQWHADRFAADARLVSLDQISVQGNTAIVDGIVTSKRLRAWRIGKLAGRATLVFEEGKIKETEIGLALG